jgi:trk system potassium uptake protein TrkH
MHMSAILFVLGWLFAAFGGFMALPALVSWFYRDPGMMAFGLSAVAAMFGGVLLILMNRHSNFYLNHKDGVLLTFLAWLCLSLIGAVPLYLTDAGIGLVDAVFESTSGLTTTGATVLSGLDTMDHGVLLWRAMLQWLGGMGIVVLAVAVLPFLGIGGLQLYRSEMPGVTKDKLQPRLHETARLLWVVYALLTVGCTLAYLWAGMSAFDALCHAFTTVSTAGFSTHDLSLGWFDSPAVETVAMVFMLLGAVNFTLHFRFIIQRRLRVYTSEVELRLFLLLLVVAVGLIAFKLQVGGAMEGGTALRQALFNTVSIVTTTGYSTSDFSTWPSAAMLILMILMFVGGCSGSTAGGMKMLRIILVIKQGAREMDRLLHPHGVRHVKMNGITVPTHIIQAVWAFAGLYIASFAVISLLMAAYGLDLVTAFAAAAATLTNVGPGLGNVGPYAGYGHLPEGAKLILCLSMLLGRLELFTVLVLLVPAFWRR